MASSSDWSEIESSPEVSSRIEWSDGDEPLCRRFMSNRRSHSKSLTRTSKSPKPKISSTRLSPILSSDDVGFGSNPEDFDSSTTKFTSQDLKRMANEYPWPNGVILCLPVDNGCSLANYPDSLVVHEDSLKAGFRLPIPTFIRDFLRWTQLCPAQISPNSWRNLSAFGIWCSKMKKEPTFLAMQYLFNMKDTGNFFYVYTNLDIVSNPSNVGSWKNKWFLVKKGDVYDFDFPIRPCKNGVKFRKGPDEMKDIPGNVKELRYAFLSMDLKRSDLHHSQLITHENLENAGLSLPHPTKSTKRGRSLIKSAIRKQNNVNSSRSEEVSKKKTVRSPSPPVSEEERPTKRRKQMSRPSLAIDSPHSLETRPVLLPLSQPNILASRLTKEEANALLEGAIVNVDAVSKLGSLPDERISSEFARSVALQVYHANNLIQNHGKLLRSKESAEQNEEIMKKEIQSLKDYLKKTQEENADNLKKIQEENAGNLKKIQEDNAEKLKKTLEENAEQRQKIMELEMDLSKGKDIRKEESLHSKRNEEITKEQIHRLEDNLKKTQEENAELLQKIMEHKMDLSKAKDMGKEKFLNSKQHEESMKKQIQSLEDNLKKTKEENADNLKKTQEENANNLKKTREKNAELRQKIVELEMDLSKAKDIGKEEFLNSNSFFRRVAHFNATYYMSGLRVGVCQAVKKYQHLDPKIVKFEPDFDDDCGYEVPDPPPYSSPIRLVP